MDKGAAVPVATHLLQHTLRSLCMESRWVYAVFWRILPRSYPPPKWDSENGVCDRSKGNKRNWILAWEDGFCDFSACSRASAESKTAPRGRNGAPAEEEEDHSARGLQPELFFKMSHEVYNFGEGLMGKVAADNSHKWIYRDPPEREVSYLSPWHSSIDPYPRTWEAQFKSGIQTIAVIAVRDGLVQLGATKKITEDLNLVILLQRKFNYLHTIPGVFLPHPSCKTKIPSTAATAEADSWQWNLIKERLAVPGSSSRASNGVNEKASPAFFGSQNQIQNEHRMVAAPSASSCAMNAVPVIPSMNSLQVLLSKLPSVTPHASNPSLLGKSVTFPRHISSTEAGIFTPNSHIHQSNYASSANGFPPTFNPPGIRTSDDAASVDVPGASTLDSYFSGI